MTLSICSSTVEPIDTRCAWIFALPVWFDSDVDGSCLLFGSFLPVFLIFLDASQLGQWRAGRLSCKLTGEGVHRRGFWDGWGICLGFAGWFVLVGVCLCSWLLGYAAWSCFVGFLAGPLICASRHPSFSSRDGIRHTEGALLHGCDEQWSWSPFHTVTS